MDPSFPLPSLPTTLPPHHRPSSPSSLSRIQYRDLCHGNNYVSTIHAISSCVIKLSKLTKAGKVFRGVCYGKLPDRFWTPSSEGICGGVEFGTCARRSKPCPRGAYGPSGPYRRQAHAALVAPATSTLAADTTRTLDASPSTAPGFQSTTRSYEQALHYAMGCGWAAHDDATTIFEISMGLVDRGAELTWLSQYPHEQEVQYCRLSNSSYLLSHAQTPSHLIPTLLSRGCSVQVLLPPLTGLEAIGSSVEGKLLSIHSRLSLNLSAQTLEQVGASSLPAERAPLSFLSSASPFTNHISHIHSATACPRSSLILAPRRPPRHRLIPFSHPPHSLG